jgi:hypothetical protein
MIRSTGECAISVSVRVGSGAEIRGMVSQVDGRVTLVFGDCEVMFDDPAVGRLRDVIEDLLGPRPNRRRPNPSRPQGNSGQRFN